VIMPCSLRDKCKKYNWPLGTTCMWVACRVIRTKQSTIVMWNVSCFILDYSYIMWCHSGRWHLLLCDVIVKWPSLRVFASRSSVFIIFFCMWCAWCIIKRSCRHIFNAYCVYRMTKDMEVLYVGMATNVVRLVVSYWATAECFDGWNVEVIWPIILT
jgi:hypothetical protein